MSTATREPALAAEVRELELEACHPNPWNKERPLDEAFLQSLREKGQIVIALARPHPTREGEYEVIFGDRRRRGLKEIGKSTLIAEVRELGDQEAEDLCLAENKQRAGLTWRQELEAIEEYLAKYPDSFAHIAAALAISVAQVRRRHKLLEKLSKSWLAAIKKGKFASWTVDHFESLIPFTEQQQESIYLNDFQWGEEHISVKDLREQLAGETRSLKSVPWDLADSTLCPAAGSCAECPKRSGANTDLFDEVDPKVKGHDRCLDEKCFGQKQKAFAERKVAEVRKEEPDVLVVSKDSYRSEGGVLGRSDYEFAKKGGKGVKKAIQVDGNGAGQVVYVKPASDAKNAVVKAMGQKPEKKPLEQRRAEKDKQRDALAIEKLIAYIEDEAGELDFTKEAQAVLTQYALAYGVEAAIPGLGEDEPKRIRAFEKKPFTAEELWDPVAMHMVGELQGVKNSLRAGEPAAEDETVQLCAWMVDADWAELRAVAAAELPDPKSWANEAAAERMAGGKKSKVSKAAAQALVDGSAADELDGPDEDIEDMDDE
jgi:ParB/RepB/Spo0J family partition protein